MIKSTRASHAVTWNKSSRNRENEIDTAVEKFAGSILRGSKKLRHWSQDRLLPFDAPILGLTEAAHFLLHMNSLILNLDAASSDAQINQGLARGLGRGPLSPSKLQSPQALKILQCNINGLSTLVTRTKLDQLLEIEDLNKVQVTAIKETKLKKIAALKIRGYNIFRADRPSRGGGGLVFFIRDVKYQSIDFSIN
ncbi:uncharacterized protein NPIL_28831 [Nephila pilipes]|uniref:Uncharacterized protein n=1 Tax=Nephila pilipes TaxID=299642 RepID=A0A8X6KA58_NEPPI|nr:uncharacterized protein NPIL_28831 [Nephila pilipes]